MAEEQINDFLLDQELEPDGLAGGSELPDDIDAILDAVADEDIETMPESMPEAMPETNLDDFLTSEESGADLLQEPIEREEEETVTGNDLEREINIAAMPDMGDDSIPLMSEIIDPNNPPQSAATTGVMTLSDDMMLEIMAKIQNVVEQSVNSEIGKLTDTVRDNVIQDVKDQLPGVLSEVLKGK